MNAMNRTQLISWVKRNDVRGLDIIMDCTYNSASATEIKHVGSRESCVEYLKTQGFNVPYALSGRYYEHPVSKEFFRLYDLDTFIEECDFDDAEVQDWREG